MADTVVRENLLGSPSSYVNPIYKDYFADPFVFRHEGVYFAVGTGPLSDEETGGQFRMLKSEDLVNWEVVGVALQTPVGFESGSFWAPEVAFSNNRFYLYYSVGQDDKAHHLRVAISDSPEGPYEDAGRLTSEDCPFAIDASPYLHTDGEWYLYYATDFLDGDRPGTGVVVDRLVDMTRLAGEPSLVARASADWQRYEANRVIYDGVYDWHTLEGPCAVFNEGKIYCLYSGGNWQNETYGLDFAVAEHPLGPYSSDTSEAPRVLRTLPGRVLGPGHNAIVTGPTGEKEYVVYHAWDPDKTARMMRIDPLIWTPSGPMCDGPSVSERRLV